MQHRNWEYVLGSNNNKNKKQMQRCISLHKRNIHSHYENIFSRLEVWDVVKIVGIFPSSSNADQVWL